MTGPRSRLGAATAAGWPGCHGVQLSRCPIDVGGSSGAPLAAASVELGPAGPASGERLWRVELEVEVEGVPVRAEQELWRRAEGTFHVQSSRGGALTVDAATSTIVLDGSEEAVVAQLLTTYGLPLLLQERGALVLHAAAFAVDGEALLVAGASGRGKSSLLVAAVDTGFLAVSEDLCVLDLRGEVPLVWPGPPWVRRRRGEPGPRDATVRFETRDKTAWDLTGRQIRGPIPLAGFVGLEQPQGTAPRLQALARPDAIRRLAADIVWLGHPDDRAAASFAGVARVSGVVAASTLQLPLGPSWLDQAPRLLAAALR